MVVEPDLILRRAGSIRSRKPSVPAAEILQGQPLIISAIRLVAASAGDTNVSLALTRLSHYRNCLSRSCRRARRWRELAVAAWSGRAGCLYRTAVADRMGPLQDRVEDAAAWKQSFVPHRLGRSHLPDLRVRRRGRAWREGGLFLTRDCKRPHLHQGAEASVCHWALGFGP
jgi:hypothetical protein